MEKPSLPSGTRDYGVDIMSKRRFILNIMEQVFRSHGFGQIETPALENLRTLQGKYGDEGDQLLFKVLNSGDFLAKASDTALAEKDSKSVVSSISDRGLRYDLTVPLARHVVMNRDKITFPFKRFQMQPVWRADRPQKGRYREFWQCDIDVVGSNSTVSEAELVEMYLEVFDKLNLKVAVRINHRGILDAFLPILGSQENWNSFMVAIDKFDKVGQEGVAKELTDRGLSHSLDAWNWICSTAQLQDFNELITALEGYSPIQNESLHKGIADLKSVFSLVDGALKQSGCELQFDLRLARGLSYYTGCVFEVVTTDERIPQDFKIGSIGGGGRYDNLTGVFGLKDVSGVGVSFGLDRIYDTLEAGDLFPENSHINGVLICCMDESAFPVAANLARSLRSLELASVEIYPGAVKLKKQLDYANAKKFGWAIILGENEIQNGQVTLKNLVSGEQSTLETANVPSVLNKNQ